MEGKTGTDEIDLQLTDDTVLLIAKFSLKLAQYVSSKGFTKEEEAGKGEIIFLDDLGNEIKIVPATEKYFLDTGVPIVVLTKLEDTTFMREIVDEVQELFLDTFTSKHVN